MVNGGVTGAGLMGEFGRGIWRRNWWRDLEAKLVERFGGERWESMGGWAASCGGRVEKRVLAWRVDGRGVCFLLLFFTSFYSSLNRQLTVGEYTLHFTQ